MKQLRLAFGFFTVLPLSRTGGIDEIAESGYLLPFVAIFLGGAEGLAGWGSLELWGPGVAAALVLALALILTGLHHADGLADVADSVMAGGDKARKLEVLKDKTMGIGALAAFILTYLVSWTAVAEAGSVLAPSSLPWLLMTVEVSARMSLLTVAFLSRPSHPGSGSAFLEALKGLRGAAGLGLSIACLAALAIPLGYLTPLVSGAAALILGLLLGAAGQRWYGGANGDLLGASVELGRMAALLAVVATLYR